jgi:hypothetical protein
MSMANVIPLIDDIKAEFDRCDLADKYETVEARREPVIAVGRKLLLLRQTAASDKAFNTLLVEQGLDRRDAVWRSNAMWLAEQIDTDPSGLAARLNRCPAASPNHIRQWFRDSEPNKKPKMPKEPKTTSAGRTPIVQAIREQVRSQVEKKEPITVAEVMGATGRSRIVTEGAIAAERGRVEGKEEARAELEAERTKLNEEAEDRAFRNSLGKTSLAKLEALERRLAKQHQDLKQSLEAGMHIKVLLLAEKHVNDHVLPTYGERLRQADLLLSGKKPLTQSEWKLLIRVVHPDNSAGKETREDAFRLLMSKEVVLADPDPAFRLSGGLPKTLAELMAMRERVKEENKAKRQARNATTH